MEGKEQLVHVLGKISSTLQSMEQSKADLRKNTALSAAAGLIAAVGTMIAVHQMAQSQAETQYELSKSHYEREIAELKHEVKVKDDMVLQLISYATSDPEKAGELVQALKENLPSATADPARNSTR